MQMQRSLWVLFFVVALLGSTVVQAQPRYAFGPKRGQLVETEEAKEQAYRESSLAQLQRIEELLKNAQASNQQLVELLKEQNRLITTLLQFQQQQQQLQLQQLQQQPLMQVPSAMPHPLQ